MQKEREVSVLVVDDDPGMVTTLRDILDATGYAVEIAHSGPEALQCVEAHQPDCILMDIRMPGMNGVDTYRELKHLTPDSFVIFMTAYANSALVEGARKEGAAPCSVLADRSQIESILVHLVENALQAMPEGGELRIRCFRRPGEVVTEVTDTGSGVSEEDLPKIFEPLYTTKLQGIGLGLTLSQRYAQINGGWVEFESVASQYRAEL